MPKLSSRIASINTDGRDGWELYRAARDRKAAGEDIIELTIGEHDIGTDKAILDAIYASALSGRTGYAATPGENALRDEVASRVQERTGVPTTRDNVLITPGGQSALFAAHLLAAGDGGSALYIDPYYATYPGTLRAAGARAVSLVTRPEDAFCPTEEALEKAIATYRAQSLLINTPNNPTGVLYPRETIETIARVVARHDIWLISDEVYDTQVWEGEHVSPRSLPGMAERTLVIGSMSKSHAMTGSRVGWIIGPPDAIEALGSLAITTTYGVPGYIQEASVFALLQGAEFEDRIAAPFRTRRDIVQELLAGNDAVGIIPSGGAMYMMLDIRKTGLSGHGFAQALLDEHLVAVMPGESFGQAAAGHVRVALTQPDDRLRDAVQRLGDFAAELAARNKPVRQIS